MGSGTDALVDGAAVAAGAAAGERVDAAVGGDRTDGAQVWLRDIQAAIRARA